MERPDWPHIISLKSVWDFGKLAVAEMLSKIDERLANAINTEEDAQ